MKKSVKTYIQQMLGVIVLYAVVLFITVRLLEALDDSPWRILAALLPMIPIVLGLLVFLQFFGEMDELQKQIQLYALAFSFGATGLLTFSYGLLQNAGMPQVSFIAVFPMMLALWGLGYVFAAWRYQ